MPMIYSPAVSCCIFDFFFLSLQSRIGQSSYWLTKVIRQPFLLSFCRSNLKVGKMEEEIWKDIPGWEGLYQASSLGRIRSYDKLVWNHNGYMLIKGRILKPSKNTYGKTPYYYVGLSDSTRKIYKSLSVHTLICSTFNGPKPKEINGDHNIDCMHLNGDSTDNKASNLAWGTHKDNMNEATCRASHISACPLSKPVIQCDLDGNEIARFPSARAAARELGLWSAPISECVRGGRYHTHGGFIWKLVKD